MVNCLSNCSDREISSNRMKQGGKRMEMVTPLFSYRVSHHRNLRNWMSSAVLHNSTDASSQMAVSYLSFQHISF